MSADSGAMRSGGCNRRPDPRRKVLDSNIRSLVRCPHGTSVRCRNMIQDTLGPHRYSRQPQRHSLPARLALIVATVAGGLVVVGGVAYAGAPSHTDRRVVPAW